MNCFEKIEKCLKALAGVDEWDARHCIFCGKRQEDTHGYPKTVHDIDCPVKLAREVLDQ